MGDGYWDSRAPDWAPCCFPHPQQRLTAHLQPFLDAVNAQRLVEFERAVAAGGKPKREHADVERREGRDLASRYAAWEGQQQEQVPPLHTMLGWGEPVPVPGAQRSAGHIPSGRRAVTSGAATTNNGQWKCLGSGGGVARGERESDVPAATVLGASQPHGAQKHAHSVSGAYPYGLVSPDPQ